MSEISSGAAHPRVSEDPYTSRGGMPLVQESPQLDLELDESPWEEPQFDVVTIAKVIYSGGENWDRSLYVLSNGRSAFASKGLDVGDSPFDYEEIRVSGGGYYDAPDGVVGHTYTRQGGVLIIKEADRFKQQQYAWGNQGPVMAPSTQDVTKQIHQIEEREDEDMNGDGVIGAPDIEEEEIEVSKVIFDDESSFDRSIYEMTDGSVVFAEQGLEPGSLPIEGEELTNKDGSPLETSGLVGITGLRNGFGVLYNNNGVITQLPFKWGRRGVQVSGKLRNITSQLSLIEEREGIDVNGDGKIGNQIDDDAVVDSVVYRSGRDGFDRSLYKMSNNQYILGEAGLETGDIPFDHEPLTAADGSLFDANGAVGLLGLRRGFGVVLKDGGKFSLQQFSWSGRGPKAKGKLSDITKRIYDVEDREGADFTDDGIIGEPYSGNDPEISRVIFPGNDEYGEGLYVMNDGSLVFAESDLDQGDTPYEDQVITGKSGKPYDASNVIGVYPIKNGFALIEDSDGTYTEQGFRFNGNSGPKPYGKPRKVKSMDKIEIKASFDIDADGRVGGDSGGGKGDDFGPEFRLMGPLDMTAVVDPLA